jgi:hypothetical protein
MGACRSPGKPRGIAAPASPARVQILGLFVRAAMILTFLILSFPRSNPPSGLKKDSDSLAFFNKERFEFNLDPTKSRS